MKKYRKNFQIIFLKNMLIVFFVGFSTIIYIDNKIRPIAMEYCINSVELSALESINKTVYDDMQLNSDLYKNIANLSGTGEFSAVITDTYKINAIKTNIMLSGEKNFNEIIIDEVSIPLGAIYNNMFFFTKGFTVPIKMIPMSTVNVDFASTFESVGINQSLHRIIMECSVDLKIITPYETVDFVVYHTIAISETLILGDVPDTYTYIDDTSTNMLDKYNNYGN
ncbi:MAG: sporulation protein YunB [Clostridia bacterium]